MAMRIFWRLAAIAVAAAFATTACGKAWVGLGFPVPGEVDSLDVPGISDDVAIDFDHLYIPHVQAATDKDAYFGIGYAMASQRLFQMDLLRHLARGDAARIAKLKVRVKQFGKGEKIDFREVGAFMKLLDFEGIGDRLIEGLSPERRALVQSFADGVNAFVRTHENELSMPYSLPLGLGRDFAPWSPGDSGAIMAMMAFTLSKNIDEETAGLFMLRDGVSVAKMLTLLAPDYDLDPRDYAYLERIAPKLRGLEFMPGYEMFRLFVQGELHVSPDTAGSNNWVVAPARSRTGHALLANDPHLGRMMPGYWWLGHIRSPGYDVAGAFIPGVPNVIIGHNGHAAWGITMVKGDNMDLAVEEIDPAALTYRVGDEWRPLGDTSFAVSGKKRKFPKSFYTTDFGPIISKVTPQTRTAISVRWASWFSNQSFEASFDLMTARSVYEVEAAAKRSGLVTLNLVSADSRGNIGWFVTGDYPRRVGYSGFMPKDGTDPGQLWDGFVGFHERAGAVNPERGFIATANHRPDSPYADAISHSYASPHRFDRISEMLDANPKHGIDDLRAQQADVKTRQAALILPIVIAAGNGDTDLANYVDELRSWNHQLSVGSHGGLYYQVFVANFVLEAIRDLSPETREAFLSSVQFNQQTVEAIPRERTGLWANPAERAELIRRALRAAKAELAEKFPKNLAKATWGDLHQLYLKHPLSKAPFVGKKYRMETLPYPGDAQTVNAGGYRPGKTYDTQYYSALRFLIDMGDPGEARVSFPGGQSENANHPAYSNMFDAWYEVQDYQLLFDADDLAAATMAARIRLEPGE